jgi:hypothetical protein
MTGLASKGAVLIVRFCKRGSLNNRFAPEATELLRRREMTRSAMKRREQVQQ